MAEAKKSIADMKKEKDELKAKLKTIYEAESKVREGRKEWTQMYVDVREKTLELNTAVKEGKTTPSDAVEELQEFVADWEYKEEK